MSVYDVEVKEKCGCGAEIVAVGLPSYVAKRVDEWRATHPCSIRANPT